MKSNDSPNFRVDKPGTPALQLMSEAQARQSAHDDWHSDHPGEPCPTSMFPYSPTDYTDIERGDCVLDFAGGGTIEPGEAFVMGRKK